MSAHTQQPAVQEMGAEFLRQLAGLMASSGSSTVSEFILKGDNCLSLPFVIVCRFN